MVDQPRYGLKN